MFRAGRGGDGETTKREWSTRSRLAILSILYNIRYLNKQRQKYLTFDLHFSDEHLSVK